MTSIPLLDKNLHFQEVTELCLSYFYFQSFQDTL